jgi:hypothetical protein
MQPRPNALTSLLVPVCDCAHEQVSLRFCWGSACWVRYLGGEHALDADERIQYSDACAAANFCFDGGVGMLRSTVQWKLDKRDILKRDFALSGRLFCALWICSQIILFMRDFPKCKREFPKFWPKADFFFLEAVFSSIWA